MRISLRIAALIGIVLLVPAVSVASAQTAPAQKPKAEAKAAAKAATHSTSGIIKSIDASTLVIAKNAKATTTETFQLTASTARKGDPVVGGKISIRYTTESGQNVATAITATAKSKGTHKVS
jgi:hypothetical protein